MIIGFLDDLVIALDTWAYDISGIGEEFQGDERFDDRSPRCWVDKARGKFAEHAGYLSLSAVTLLAAERRDYLAGMVSSTVDAVLTAGLNFASRCAESSIIPNVRRWKITDDEGNGFESEADFDEEYVARISRISNDDVHGERTALLAGLALFESLNDAAKTLGAVTRAIVWVDRDAHAESDETLKPARQDARTYTPGELAGKDQFDCSPGNLLKYAKIAGVKTPPNAGGQGHRYSEEDRLRIADGMVLSKKKAIRERAQLIQREGRTGGGI